MGATKTRIALVVGALVLFVLLFIAPKTLPADSGKTAELQKAGPVNTNATLDLFVKSAVKSLGQTDKTRYDRLLEQQKTDSLIALWDKLKRPDIASFYSEELAKKTKASQDWLKAGERYYYAIAFTKDNSQVPVMYQSAMRCYSKGLEGDPTNVDARIMLASCYVEGSANPMEGINRLRDIEKTDSNNVKLQLAFAFFSVKSGQLDKAITRFVKVLNVDSTYIEAYLHLADAYERKGDVEKTVQSLEKYAAKTPDITAKLEIEKYIKQLKQN